MAEEKAAEPKAAAPKAEKKKGEGPTRQPSAKKRDLQNERRRNRNRSYRASVLTMIRSLKTSIAQKESPEAIKNTLNRIYSLMDKGVKQGVFKLRKAARTKSRLTARCSK